MKNAKEHFERHDSINELFFTSDHMAFFEKQNALNHAKDLEDATVTTMTREEIYTELEDIDSYSDDELFEEEYE